MSPVRIQRQRTKGWRAPLCSCGCGKPARYVGRPGKWGNPYHVERRPRPVGLSYRAIDPERWAEPVWQVFDDNGVEYDWAATKTGALDLAVQTFVSIEVHYRYGFGGEIYPFADLSELRGHDLMCWCPLGQPCHADVLLALANGDLS